MTVDEFLVWAEGRPGRHELVDGRVCAMAPERAGHARAKLRAQRALEGAIARAGVLCEALPDGMTVRIDARTAYEPDALVYCGPRLPANEVIVPAPVVVVEVLSPSTGFFDRHGKLAGYFAVPSIRHYLIVDIDRRMVIHHARDGDEIRTRLVPSGPLRLDPPGLDLDAAALFDEP
ncbi:Uma2 family endonuclease [Lichenibacterium dinghuense]|uniref:Uma2 family endonuclease n=1 Tax=Lichenibacterium dinghuense TaxID=2895977 RepID=UPI001F1A4D2F|nr:Uma2 family endonuclease [Lichenibacterium sp. 6Y81]